MRYDGRHRGENLFAQYQQNVTRLLSLGSALPFFFLLSAPFLRFSTLEAFSVKRYQHVCHTFSSPRAAEQRNAVRMKRNEMQREMF
jgi:hypothetical protein